MEVSGSDLSITGYIAELIDGVRDTVAASGKRPQVQHLPRVPQEGVEGTARDLRIAHDLGFLSAVDGVPDTRVSSRQGTYIQHLAIAVEEGMHAVMQARASHQRVARHLASTIHRGADTSPSEGKRFSGQRTKVRDRVRLSDGCLSAEQSKAET